MALTNSSVYRHIVSEFSQDSIHNLIFFTLHIINFSNYIQPSEIHQFFEHTLICYSFITTTYSYALESVMIYNILRGDKSSRINYKY